MVTLNDLTRFLNPIKRKFFLLIGKALLTAVNNSGKVGYYDSGNRKNPQRLTMEWFGQLTDIERSQSYGFETYPIVGTAKVVLVSPDGARGNTFAVMVQDDEHRPIDGIEGETIHYGPLDDSIASIPTYQRIIMKADGSVEIKAGETTEIILIKDGDITIISKTKTIINAIGNVEINTDGDAKITVIGNLDLSAAAATLDCNLTVTSGDVIADGISLKTHFHEGNLGFPTGIALDSGGGTTPSSLPSTNDAGDIIDGSSKNLSTHTHSQGVDAPTGDTQQNTSTPL